MKLPAAIAGLDAAAALPVQPLHLAIGMFDGVHLGHRAVVESAVLSARQSRGLAAALTFDPHPSRLLRPNAAVPMLQSAEIRIQRLLAAGLDAVIMQPFTTEFAGIEAAAFLPMLQKALPHLRTIYVGANWRFGRGRSGDVAMLTQAARAGGLRVFSAPRVNYDGDAISSTRIREALQAGELDLVNAMLGYTYCTDGTVAAGQALGRRIGFPTLNVAWPFECRPRFGVYAVRVKNAGATDVAWQPAVANFGLRPTVESGDVAPRLEIHVLENTALTHGDRLQVEWLRFQRDERRFGSVDELRAQIAADAAAARAYFADEAD